MGRDLRGHGGGVRGRRPNESHHQNERRKIAAGGESRCRLERTEPSVGLSRVPVRPHRFIHGVLRRPVRGAAKNWFRATANSVADRSLTALSKRALSLGRGLRRNARSPLCNSGLGHDSAQVWLPFAARKWAAACPARGRVSLSRHIFFVTSRRTWSQAAPAHRSVLQP